MNFVKYLLKFNKLLLLKLLFLYRKIFSYLKILRIGFLYKLKPISDKFGFDRGKPIDRYYIEKFLELNSKFIKGSVLEIGEDAYSKKFGRLNVQSFDILHPIEGNPRATIIGDLSKENFFCNKTFDCIIFTQTLNCIFDIKIVVKNLYSILKPGGVLLLTVPGISRISDYDMNRWGEYWRFTPLAIKKLLAIFFDEKNINIGSYGNALSAISFLHGLSFDELTKYELDYKDNSYPIIVFAVAYKDKL